MSLTKAKIASLKIDKKQNLQTQNEKIWLLNLDQIEQHTGKIISKEYINISELGASTHYFSKGTVLYSKLRPYLNKVVVADEDGFATTELVPINCDFNKINPEYLAYFLRSEIFLTFATNVVAGAKMPRMVMSEFWNYEIPLPTLEEQRRIVSILDKADELRQKRQHSIGKLDQLLQATFIDMFGDPITNPKGWEIFKSKMLFQVPPRIGTTTPANGEGIPVVRVGELGQFNINFDACGRVEISETDFEKFQLKSGDIVLARAIGSKNQLGKCSYFSSYAEPVCIDSHVMRLRPDSKKMHPLWFYFLLSSDQGKKILQAKGGATAVQFNINSAQANDLDIALPPLVEQTKFVEIANKILKNKESHIKALEANTKLFSSLQNKAFSGTL